jgi:secreted trypsin-like serine protease
MNLVNAGLLLSIVTLLACSDRPADSSAIHGDGIVGGEKALDADIGRNSTVILYKSGKAFCTGTLISERVVLTAGHCLKNLTSSAIEVRLSKESAMSAGIVSVIHPEFKMAIYDQGRVGRSNNQNDVALLALDEALAGSVVAALPAGPLTLGHYEDLKAFGAGRTDSRYQETGYMRTVSLQGDVLEESPLKISFDQRQGQGLCYGDSGGPIFQIIEGRAVLVGVTSAADRWPVDGTGVGQNMCTYYGLATQVGSYVEWISSARQNLELEIRRFDQDH